MVEYLLPKQFVGGSSPVSRSIFFFRNLSEVRSLRSKQSLFKMSDPLLSKPTLYVLISEKDNRIYVGSTNNFDQRLKLHNSGSVQSTKHRIPFKLLFKEESQTIQEAKKRELYYKSGAGRRKLKQFFAKLQ